MEETLKQLHEKHSNSLIIILFGDNIRIYDEDARILEYNSNLISEKNVLICKYKYLENVKNILKSRKINYVILDKDSDYKIFDYYYNEKNTYNSYKLNSKKFNKFRKPFIYFYNLVFGLPFNRYK